MAQARMQQQAPPMAPPMAPAMSPEQELLIKHDLLYQIERLRKRGGAAAVEGGRALSTSSSLEEIRAEHERLKRDREVGMSIAFQRKALLTVVLPSAPKSLGSKVLDKCTLAEVTLRGPVTVGAVLRAASRHYRSPIGEDEYKRLSGSRETMAFLHVSNVKQLRERYSAFGELDPGHRHFEGLRLIIPGRFRRGGGGRRVPVPPTYLMTFGS